MAKSIEGYLIFDEVILPPINVYKALRTSFELHSQTLKRIVDYNIENYKGC